MDYAVGKLMTFLKKNNMDENTLIVFISDNGSQYEGSNNPLRGEKCFQYEGGIRVPFIANWKGRIAKKTKSKAIGHFTDLLPTIASITRSQLPQDRTIDGENLSAALFGTSKNYQRKGPVFFYRYFHDPICMLRQDNMVLLGYQNKPKPLQVDYNEITEALFKPDTVKNSQWEFQKSHMEAIKNQVPIYFELYNLNTDLGQHLNVALKNPEIVKTMKRIMLNKRNEMVEEGGDWFKPNRY